MAASSDVTSMALFCDFENIALGVRDAKYDKFDIAKVLERLLLKGSIVVKKAYCDWDRYKEFKAPMHEAAFELIEIPHVRQSGKNSADIRMVVDALDLCYTKSHVDTFVIISGDSDFSPLVTKLRENDKTGDRRGRQELDFRPARSPTATSSSTTTTSCARRRRRRAQRGAAKARGKAKAPATQGGGCRGGRSRGGRRRASRRRAPGRGARPHRRDRRSAGRRARRRGEDLGLDGQAGAQAPQARLQRVVLRLSLVQRHARGGRAGGQPGARARRESPAATACASPRPRNRQMATRSQRRHRWLAGACWRSSHALADAAVARAHGLGGRAHPEVHGDTLLAHASAVTSRCRTTSRTSGR